jgi:hypothetical protein
MTPLEATPKKQDPFISILKQQKYSSLENTNSFRSVIPKRFSGENLVFIAEIHHVLVLGVYHHRATHDTMKNDTRPTPKA